MPHCAHYALRLVELYCLGVYLKIACLQVCSCSLLNFSALPVKLHNIILFEFDEVPNACAWGICSYSYRVCQVGRIFKWQMSCQSRPQSSPQSIPYLWSEVRGENKMHTVQVHSERMRGAASVDGCCWVWRPTLADTHVVRPAQELRQSGAFSPILSMGSAKSGPATAKQLNSSRIVTMLLTVHVERYQKV